MSRLYNGQYQVLDFIDYTNLPANYSYGSFPNGQSFERRPFYTTTPGSANVVASLPPLSYIPYTSAGWVRRGLQQAGFVVERMPGFGRKREMVRGQLNVVAPAKQNGNAPRTTAPVSQP